MEKFRREAPKEDNLSLEPLYRYLPETPAHDILQKDSGKAVRLNQERWGYDDWKLVQNGKVVKRDFGFLSLFYDYVSG